MAQNSNSTAAERVSARYTAVSAGTQFSAENFCNNPRAAKQQLGDIVNVRYGMPSAYDIGYHEGRLAKWGHELLNQPLPFCPEAGEFGVAQKDEAAFERGWHDGFKKP